MDTEETKKSLKHPSIIPGVRHCSVKLHRLEEKLGIQCTVKKGGTHLSASSYSENLIMQMELAWKKRFSPNKSQSKTNCHHASPKLDVKTEFERHGVKDEDSGLLIEIGNVGRLFNIDKNGTVKERLSGSASTQQMKYELPDENTKECMLKRSYTPDINTDKEKKKNVTKVKIEHECNIESWIHRKIKREKIPLSDNHEDSHENYYKQISRPMRSTVHAKKDTGGKKMKLMSATEPVKTARDAYHLTVAHTFDSCKELTEETLLTQNRKSGSDSGNLGNEQIEETENVRSSQKSAVDSTSQTRMSGNQRIASIPLQFQISTNDSANLQQTSTIDSSESLTVGNTWNGSITSSQQSLTTKHKNINTSHQAEINRNSPSGIPSIEGMSPGLTIETPSNHDNVNENQTQATVPKLNQCVGQLSELSAVNLLIPPKNIESGLKVTLNYSSNIQDSVLHTDKFTVQTEVIRNSTNIFTQWQPSSATGSFKVLKEILSRRSVNETSDNIITPGHCVEERTDGSQVQTETALDLQCQYNSTDSRRNEAKQKTSDNDIFEPLTTTVLVGERVETLDKDQNQAETTLDLQCQDKSRYSLRNVEKPKTYAESSDSEQSDDDDSDDTSDESYEEDSDEFDTEDDERVRIINVADVSTKGSTSANTGLNNHVRIWDKVQQRRDMKMSVNIPLRDVLYILGLSERSEERQGFLIFQHDVNTSLTFSQVSSSRRNVPRNQNQEKSITNEREAKRHTEGKHVLTKGRVVEKSPANLKAGGTSSIENLESGKLQAEGTRSGENLELEKKLVLLDKEAKALEDKWKYMYGEEGTFTNLHKVQKCLNWQMCVYDDSEAFRKFFDFVEWNCFMRCTVCMKVFETFADYIYHSNVEPKCSKENRMPQSKGLKQCRRCKKSNFKTGGFVRHMLKMKSHGSASCAYVPKPRFLDAHKDTKQTSKEYNTCEKPYAELSVDARETTDLCDHDYSSAASCTEKPNALERVTLSRKGAHVNSKASAENEAKWLNTFEPGFQCKVCSDKRRVFISLYQAIRHIKKQHTNEEDTELYYRKKVYYNGTETLFVKRSQNRSEGYLCSICGKSFKQKHSYHAHLVTVHKDIPPKDLGVKNEVILCQHCGKSFSIHQRRKYRNHSFTHTEPVKCEVCNTSFKNKSSYLRHLSIHQNIQNTCKECGKTYENKWNYQQHLRNHRLNASERKYKCEVCDKTFMYKHHLTNHSVVHSTSRQFACNDCGMTFKLKHHLKNHLEKACPKRKQHQNSS
ncbi:hypothetical protein FSP39_014031 [Pinctada imbricata]|uniref:C2H2-type domain-containing protein n=1 Tax=Pinctada imbricata TaxID=66713 RepID=A0AA88Y7T4_PINIB|nr:hypothetical protein FSP39_014031 [Pinctada imbricata]